MQEGSRNACLLSYSPKWWKTSLWESSPKFLGELPYASRRDSREYADTEWLTENASAHVYVLYCLWVVVDDG